MANQNATCTVNASMQAAGDPHPSGQKGVIFLEVVRSGQGLVDFLESFSSPFEVWKS